MTRGQKTFLALCMLFACAALARNRLQTLETYDGTTQAIPTIKGTDFQFVTGGSDGNVLTRDSTTAAGAKWATPAAGITGSGTSTYCTYWDGPSSIAADAGCIYDAATNTLTIDTDTLTVDGTNNRIGVLDTTPDYDIDADTTRNGIVAMNAQNRSNGASASGAIIAQADGSWGAIQCFSTGYGPTSWGGIDIADKCWIGAWDSVQFVGNGSATPRDLYFIQNGNNVSTGQIAQFITSTQTWTFNPLGENEDFQIQSDNQANCFYVDGSADTISTTCDVSFPTGSIETGEIEDSTIAEADLKVVDAPADEECLTYETTTGDFEWQACDLAAGDNVQVDSAPTTDPDFQDGDVDFTYAAGVVTATVGCSGCVDATDLATDSCAADEIAANAVTSSELAADSLTPADLDAVSAAGAGQDEYCLTYEHGTTEFAWQVCTADADYGDITVSSGVWNIDANTIGTSEIATDGVGAAEIAADAVGTSEIATDGVGSAEIAADAVGSSEIATDAIGTAQLSAAAVCEAWPIGSIYLSINSTNPGTSLGCGTWSAFGTGRVMVGFDSGDTNFDTDEETGGSTNHTHSVTSNVAVGDHAAHTHTFTQSSNAATPDLLTASAVGSAVAASGTTGNPSATLTHSVTNNAVTSGNQSAIPMPYITVRFWKRTA